MQLSFRPIDPVQVGTTVRPHVMQERQEAVTQAPRRVRGNSYFSTEAARRAIPQDRLETARQQFYKDDCGSAWLYACCGCSFAGVGVAGYIVSFCSVEASFISMGIGATSFGCCVDQIQKGRELNDPNEIRRRLIPSPIPDDVPTSYD